MVRLNPDNQNTQSFSSTQTAQNQTETKLENSLGTQTNQTEHKGFFKLPDIALQAIPFIPLVLEFMTGQKIPQMTGTMAEIQQGIQLMNANLQLVLNNQQQIHQRIVNLENSASNQLLSLDQRIENLQSMRLTHEREKKQIDFNPNRNLTQTYEQ